MHQQATHADAQLEHRVDPQRVALASRNRGVTRLPRHMPPMKMPSSTPRDTAEDPIESWSSWNQTTS